MSSIYLRMISCKSVTTDVLPTYLHSLPTWQIRTGFGRDKMWHLTIFWLSLRLIIHTAFRLQISAFFMETIPFRNQLIADIEPSKLSLNCPELKFQSKVELCCPVETS